MDIEAQVKELTEFASRARKMLEVWEAFQASGGAPDANGAAHMAEQHLDHQMRRHSGLENRVAEMKATFEENIEVLQKSTGDAMTAITDLQQFREKLEQLLEGIAGLKDMAEWFAGNRAGLDALLPRSDDGKIPAEPAPVS